LDSDGVAAFAYDLAKIAKDDPLAMRRPVVNFFTRYMMGGFSFQAHQAELHYCPVHDRQIMGGVGSGKTHPCTVSAMVRASVRPGYRVLWVAPILPQAKLAYDIVRSQTAGRRWESIFMGHSRRHPYPLIELRKWDQYDPGGVFECRSLGQDPAEMLRGGEYNEAVADEAMRAFMTTWYIALISGRLRGADKYMLAINPEMQDTYTEWIEAIQYAESREEKEEMRDALEDWIKESGVEKETWLTVIGNAPRGADWWERWQWGFDHPELRYSVRWTTFQNAYVTSRQIALQRQQYEGMEDLLKVELGAERPPASGDIFPDLRGFFSDELIRLAIKAQEEGEPGWVLEMHAKHGLIHYEKPVDPQGSYVFALDPGSGQYPHRNKWVLIGARVDKNPNNGNQFEIVYIRTGNHPGQSGPDYWIAAAQDVKTRYPIMQGLFGVESSGVQKNTHTVVWGDDLILEPFMMNNVVHTLVIQAQREVGADMWLSPFCTMFDNELSEATLEDLRDAKVRNDFLSAFLILCALVYPIVHDRWEPQRVEREVEVYEMPGGREVRTIRTPARRR